MDPDATLAEAREALIGFQTHSDRDLWIKAAIRVAEAFEALDGWLTKGGFLPADWAR